MKKIIAIICMLSLFTIVIFMQSHACEDDFGCTCGPTRWETLRAYIIADCIDGPVNDEEKYIGTKTVDEDKNTAWCTSGIGYSITYNVAGIGINQSYGIEILPGCAKSDKLFKMNNRPKKILIELICSEHPRWGAKELIAYSKEIVLKDERNYQKFMLNGKNMSEIIEEYCVKNKFLDYAGNHLRLTILDVYKGSKYDDTCISEVRFLDKKGKPIKLLPDMK